MTTLRPNLPPEMWSMVVAIFAATMGCTVGRWEVANIAMSSVASATPTAQVYVSKHVPLKFVVPPSPFQRAIGTSASNPSASARRAIARVCSHLT